MRVLKVSLVFTLLVLHAGCRRSDPVAVAAAPVASAEGSGRSNPGDATLPPSSAAHLPPDCNVLLITVDSLRADMPWAGYARPIAPRLTEFEKQTVSYTHAYSLSSYTSMSLGGLLGGKYPGEMQRDGYFFGTYRKDNLMFPERLQAASIRTMSAHAHGYFRKGAAGFDQGFDVYELVPNLKWNPTTDENISGPAMEKMAESFLSKPENTAGRFFAWFHFLDPHDQYMRHPGIENYGSKARDLYDGEVTFTDQLIGKLIDFVDAAPWGKRTIVVFSADHGEAFGEHGLHRHAFELYQPLVRVPWMFRIPGVSPKRIEDNRSHIDLAPTILDFFGLPHEDLAGVSLLPELLGSAEPQPRDVIVDLPRTSNSDRRRALIHDHYKLIAFGDDTNLQVFDLDADPEEAHPLLKTDRAQHDAMVALYRAQQRTLHDVCPYACRTLTGAPPGRAY